MDSLSEKDRQELDAAIVLLKSYGALEIFLFGSMARGDMDEHSDWDLAVRGLPPASYFNALARLMKILSRTVDLVDLDEANPFSVYVTTKDEFTRVA
ncbi:MAG: nucleotidyltransferase domain-containing protein [Spirochaetia bacterium]|jgi:predicted nucleotidyltransferase|nr:nucleotidyltransferase domain-containing protein [Spirochaetia bacterium]